MITRVETYYSMDVGGDLASVRWTGLTTPALQIDRLVDVLGWVARSGWLRDLGGPLVLRVPHGDDERQETWPVPTIDPPGIRALGARLLEVQQAFPGALPESITLGASGVLLLPEGVTEVVVLGFDLEDADPMGTLRLVPATGVESAPGHAAWLAVRDQAEGEEDAPLYLQLDCGISQSAQHLRLRLRSRYDLWRARRFDGTASPIGAVNFERAQAWIGQLAADTGGTVG